MLTELTETLRTGHDLKGPEVSEACSLLLDETVGDSEKAGFLRALREKGETPEEIAAFVANLLERAVQPGISQRGLLDVCGTGGDKMGFFNISTAVMFVVAACGVPVVKHGNRGVTSKSGGADVLEALGVAIDLPPERAGEALQQAGCTFLFAPLYHPAFKAVAPVRKALGREGISTVFNLIGPLLNPTRPEFQIAGVFDAKWLPAYAETLRLLGRRQAWAVHGHGPGGTGLDEVSSLGPTEVCSLENGVIRRFTFDAAAHRIPLADSRDLLGGDAAQNAEILLGLLRGEDAGARRDIVLLNAACALVVAGRAADFPVGLALAREALVGGEARRRLELLKALR